LDVSANMALTSLYAKNNQLTYLNMRNGITDALTTFDATNNDSLVCIETLDPYYATANWTNANGNIDEGVTFSVICGSEDQDVWHVSTNGSDGSGNGTQNSPFATIQMGINAAGNGNTVQVAAGTYLAPNEPYYGNDDSAGPNLYEKEDLAILGDGSATTIIDMDGHTYGFCFSRNSINNIIDGFTIKNGGYTLISAYNNSWGNTFQNCVLLTDGGENYTYESYDSGDYFINCTFVGNGNNDVHYDNETQSVFTNSIFYHFDDFINENYLESITVSNSLFYEVGGGLPEGETLIFQDPLFCEPDSANYHLAGNSPSLGTGEDGADMGALGVGCDDIWLPPTIATMEDTSMDEDSELSLHLSAESEQGYDIYFEVESDTSSVYVYTEDDMLHINLETNWNGSSQITVMAYSDFDYEINNTTSFTLTVNPVNDEPMFHNLHRLVAAGMEFHVPIHVSDVDMDSLVVSLDDSWDYPDWLSLTDNPYALTGTALEPVSIDFPLQVSDGQSTVTDTFHLSAQFFNPRITAVMDIPEDQGARVYVNFLKSFFDHPNESNQMYTVFRHDMVDNVPEWVVVGSGAAIGDGSYTYEVSTLMDSTSEGDGMTEFKVVASMDEGHFHSLPVSGYSIDNIAPGVPQGLMAALVDDGIQLTWEMSADEDFQYYMLEKSSDEAFTEPEVFEMIDIAYLDLDYVLNESNYYRIAAVDHAGNISDYSDVVDFAVLVIDLDLTPEVFALHQNYPNPFNPTTQIKYDLPEDAMVSITIYDVMGRSIKSLVNTTQSAGYCSIQWDATNNYGESVSAGMYIYTIQTGDFRATKKMVLLK